MKISMGSSTRTESVRRRSLEVFSDRMELSRDPFAVSGMMVGPDPDSEPAGGSSEAVRV